MAGFVVKNNAESLVADNPLASGATTLNVTSGEGDNFPSTFPYRLTIWDDENYADPTDDSGMEIVECTGRSGDALTIVRGKEGTSDVDHTNGERVAMLITAGLFNDSVHGIITKLDGIEDNATADQTGAEIKAAYEVESNAYNDTKDGELSDLITACTLTALKFSQVTPSGDWSTNITYVNDGDGADGKGTADTYASDGTTTHYIEFDFGCEKLIKQYRIAGNDSMHGDGTYKLMYWNGADWVDWITDIPTSNSAWSSWVEGTSTSTSKIRLYNTVLDTAVNANYIYELQVKY